MDSIELCKKITEKIAALRRAKGLGHKDMGAKIYRSPEQYRAIESGRSGTSLDCFLRMAEALEISPAEIIKACIAQNNEGNPPPPAGKHG